MATETFYVKKEDVEDFKAAKAVLGERYSAHIMRSLKDYVIAKEKEDLGYADISIFEGLVYYPENLRKGTTVNFIGKELSRANVEKESGDKLLFKLYLSRKGRFLVYNIHYKPHQMEEKHDYQVFENNKEMREGLANLNLPPYFLTDLEQNFPDVCSKVLDI